MTCRKTQAMLGADYGVGAEEAQQMVLHAQEGGEAFAAFEDALGHDALVQPLVRFMGGAFQALGTGRRQGRFRYWHRRRQAGCTIGETLQNIRPLAGLVSTEFHVLR